MVVHVSVELVTNFGTVLVIFARTDVDQIKYGIITDVIVFLLIAGLANNVDNAHLTQSLTQTDLLVSVRVLLLTSYHKLTHALNVKQARTSF